MEGGEARVFDIFLRPRKLLDGHHLKEEPVGVLSLVDVQVLPVGKGENQAWWVVLMPLPFTVDACPS